MTFTFGVCDLFTSCQLLDFFIVPSCLTVEQTLHKTRLSNNKPTGNRHLEKTHVHSIEYGEVRIYIGQRIHL